MAVSPGSNSTNDFVGRERSAPELDATKVLIVDDSRIDAERSRMELRRAGVSDDFLIVADKARLPDALRTFCPDAVVCELSFRDFDGYAAQRIVRDIQPSTPVIFVSASSSEDAAAAVARSGAADYIPKTSLFRLPGAVRQAVREARENARVDTSFGTSAVRSRQHIERLEAIWRIVSDPNLHGDDAIAAFIGEAVAKMGRGHAYFGMLGHVDGAEFVIDTVVGELGPADGPGRRLIRVGARGAIGDVLHSRDIAAGRTNSWDDIDSFPNPPAYSREAGLRSQITTQFMAGGMTYVLTLGSLEAPSVVPFSADDYGYMEAVGSILAQRLESERHEGSLRDAEFRSRRHAERLDALWRIFNSTNLRGDDLVLAMLREGSAAMRPPHPWGGTLGHIEGDEFVLDAIAGEAGPATGPARRLLPGGYRGPLSESLVARDLGAARTQSWDDCLAVPDLPERTRAAGIRTQITTQFVANETVYVLSLGSLEPQTAPFTSEDYDYIEVLGSMFARQLELEAKESSLREAELRSRHHAQRLDALWRVVNDPNLRGPALVDALLHEVTGAMRQGHAQVSLLRHVEGSHYVIDAVAGDLGPQERRARRLLAVGTRIPFGETVPHHTLGGRTRSWADMQTIPGLPPRIREVGWRSAITTTFEAAARVYELTVGSLDTPLATPFTPDDEEYVEVLASVLARQLDLESMEGSLSAAELRSRQHAERLEVLWRIASNPTLRGPELMLAMLQQGAAGIRPDQSFQGVLARIEGEEFVVIGVGEDPADDDPNFPRPKAGRRAALSDTMLPLVGRTRAWDDLAAVGTELPRMETSFGLRAFIATAFEAGGAQYALAFGSREPAREPFGPEDSSYIEVLAASFANQLQVSRLEESLHEEEDQSRQHAERLEALWRIINNSTLRDEELVMAMLQEAAAAIQPGQFYEALLLRVEGDHVIVEAVTNASAAPSGDPSNTVGAVLPLKTTSLGRVLAEGGGTRSWDDVVASPYASEATRTRGTRSMVITTFVAGGATWALAFTSTRTSRKSLGRQDHAYIEVLASFFANHLQQRWQFDRIQYQQSHDILTGLVNRSTFRSRARAASRTSSRYAVIMVDIDALHEINESFGHITGDAVLVEVANALKARATKDEIVGRVGGDVFGIFVPDSSSAEMLFARVLDFADVFSHGFSTGDRHGQEFVSRTACIGVASSPEDGREFESILSRADAALYTAQERGHGSLVLYVAGMEAEAQRRATLQNELVEAITGEQFTLYYQPHIELRTGAVAGCEALIRWNHPIRGLLAPGHFIPFAEQTGIITRIDDWVMQKAFAMANELGAQRPGFRLYFNLSGRQAGDPKVVRAFTAAARSGVALSNIGVEITETDAMRNVDLTRHVCRALRRLNVRIAIDDFGTGYSSLSSLKKLPVDIVKIDRAFISGVLNDQHDQTITATIISIAEQFGFESLAEGAEQPEELEWLGDHGCRYVQGYAVCHPLPLDEFKNWIADHDRNIALN